MKINELTYFELKKIIIPVIQLQPMSYVVAEMGKVLSIIQPTRQKIQEKDDFLTRYKGFEVFISDFRWLKNRGPSISIQFKRKSTKFQSFISKMFPESNRFIDMICGEVICDLKRICLNEIEGVEFVSTTVSGYSAFGKEEMGFRVTYPFGTYNYNWKEGREIAPLMITTENHSNKWFISFSFNAASFVRDSDRTILREDWINNIADVTKSIYDSVDRNYHPDSLRKKTYEEWSEDMIIDFGDEINTSLPEIWITINDKRD